MENSLDAAESIRVPPHVEVEVEELSSADFRQLRGLKNLVMQDEALYRQVIRVSGDRASPEVCQGVLTCAATARIRGLTRTGS